MTTTSFVVRSDAGVLVQGVVGKGGVAALSPQIGDEISLNLQPSQVLSYMRDGAALRVTLVNGEVITIQDFFSAAGTPQAELYLSTNGALVEVEVLPGEGALLNAHYVQADPSAKWSPDEALYFNENGALPLDGVQDVTTFTVPTALAEAPLGLLGLGALAALGAGAAAQGGGVATSNSDDTPGQPDGSTGDGPVVAISDGTKENGDTVNADDQTAGVSISGTGTPGASGTVVIGDAVQDVIITPEGDWTTTFEPDAVLPGEYEVDVVVTVTNDDGTTTAIGTVAVDTVADVTFDPATVGNDGLVNEDDVAEGITLEGTTEPGSDVIVQIDGTDYPATVVDDTWTVEIPSEEVEVGDTAIDVIVNVTDPNGNTDTVAGVIDVDTQTFVTVDTSAAGGDGVVNEAEHPSGVTINGMAEPGSVVDVTLGDVVQTVSADDSGAWTVTYPASDVPKGEFELPVTAVSTDPAGNSATASGSVLIDTEIDVAIDDLAEGVVNLVERADGIALTGTADAGASLVVNFGSTTQTTTADGSGNWSVGIDASDIPLGELSVPVDVTATDAAGNTAMATSLVEIDTSLPLSFNADAVEGDGIVNAVERADGVTLTGQTQAGASVVVDFDGASQTVTAENDGDWSATFAAGQVPTGTFDADVTVSATDAAGNTAEISDTVRIDTEIGLTIGLNAVGGDGTINAAERAAGVDIGGTADAGSTVSVSFAGTTKVVTADGAGNWSAGYTASEIPQGTTTVNVTAMASDIAGNTASTSGVVNIDTVVNPLTASDTPVEGDDVVNIAEATDGIALSGTVEAGSSVTVTFQGTARAATVGADGTWTVAYSGSEVPVGTYTSVVSISATDAAGNTSTITDTFLVDTVAPDAPNIESFSKGEDGLRGFGIENTADDITVSEFVEGAATATSVDIGSGGFENPITGELNFGFADGHEVPNGSHLVVTATDAAGNANGTFFVLDDSAGASAIDVSAGALDGFNVGAIDLELFAEEASITLNAADIAALSSNDNTLVINGKSDDTITLDGTATAVGAQVIDGHDYTVYDVDSSAAQLIIRDDLEFNQAVV